MPELAVIWTIVVLTIAWFISDERRIRTEKLDQAARFYARAPQYRFVSVADPH